MTPEQRLLKAFELSDLARQKFLRELRKRFPNLSEAEFRKVLIAHMKEKSRQELLIYKGLFSSQPSKRG
jgi:F0F1-type ATP synthase membrane subunit b/b'